MVADNEDNLLAVPPRAPRVHGAVGRWVGRCVLRLGGWRIVGQLPDTPRLVLIGAPHSSNWDGIWGFAAKLALGLDIQVLGKESLFRVPVVGPVLRWLGVIPINRGAAQGVVQQAAAMLRNPAGHGVWVGLAPEGTRKRVEHWKTGFWKIAKAADVPVLPMYFHYPERIIGFGELFELTDDMRADIRRIRAWYSPWQGKRRGVD